MTNHNERLGIKNIAQHQKKSFGEVVGLYLKSPWCFDSWIEKLILMALTLLGLWKIFGWVY